MQICPPKNRLERLTPERDNVLVPLRDRFEDADLVPDLSCAGEAKWFPDQPRGILAR